MASTTLEEHRVLVEPGPLAGRGDLGAAQREDRLDADVVDGVGVLQDAVLPEVARAGQRMAKLQFKVLAEEHLALRLALQTQALHVEGVVLQVQGLAERHRRAPPQPEQARGPTAGVDDGRAELVLSHHRVRARLVVAAEDVRALLRVLEEDLDGLL